MLSVVMLSVVMLNVFMLNVFMLSGVAPSFCPSSKVTFRASKKLKYHKIVEKFEVITVKHLQTASTNIMEVGTTRLYIVCTVTYRGQH